MDLASSLFFLLVFRALSVNSQDPVFPDYNSIELLGSHSHVEVTNGASDNTFTFFVDEYHDMDGRRGRVDMDYVDISSLFYFSNMKQAVTFTKSGGRPDCTVYDFTELPILEMDTSYWGWLDKKNRIFGPSALIWRPTKNKPVFVKEAIVRGIKANVFKGEDIDDKVEVTYYFADSKWKNTVGSNMPIPIRISAIGTLFQDDDITSSMNMTLDFVYFSPNVSSQLVFMLPTGVGCSGLRVPADQTLPGIEGQYSFVAELYDIRQAVVSVETSVVLNKVWYDNLNSLVRLDSSDSTEIQDFNTGVSYTILTNGTCLIGPILNSISEKTTGLVGAMKDPRAFLEMDGEYYYIGRGYYRSIFCDIWEAVKYSHAADPTQTTYSKIIYTYYFMASKIEAITEGDRNYQSPVSLTITGYQTNTSKTAEYRVVYNFFDFDQADGRLFYEEMNVGKCFPSPNQKQLMSVLFRAQEGHSATLLAQSYLSLKTQALLEIASEANVSMIRFPYFELSFQNDGILAIFDLIDGPAIMAGFYNYERNLRPSKIMDKVQVVSNKEECAKQCIQYSNYACKSFLICDSECYVGQYDGREEWQHNDTGQNNCDLYIRSISTSNLKDLPLKEAIASLNDSVAKRRLQIDFEDPKSKENINFYGVEVKSLVLTPTSKQYELVFVENQLTSTSETTIQIEEVNTSDECHKHCKDKSSIVCVGFSFCPSTKNCRLTSIYLSSDSKDSQDQVVIATQCNVYRATAMELFDETPGKVPFLPGDKAVYNITSRELCAATCVREKLFRCRGFEFCVDSQSCSLHKVHFLDLGATQDAPATCTHYSMKYSADFLNAGHLLVVDPHTRIIIANNLEQCLKICYNQPASDPCRSVNFCPNTNGPLFFNCVINSVSSLDRNVKTELNEKCNHYISGEIYPVGPTKTPVTTIDPPQGDEIYTPLSLLRFGEYQVHTEITNLVDNPMTFFVNEYHNSIKKEGLINQWAGGVQSSLYYFTNTQQVVAVGGGKCRVDSFRNASFLQETINWGWLNPEYIIIGPSAVLWRNTLDQPKYVGKSLVRGIECSQFVAIDKLDTEIELTFYVPVSKWGTATGMTFQTPSRVVANGTYSLGGRKIKLNTQMDFIYFRSNLQGSKANLMLPKGLGCVNLLNREVRVMPQMEQTISFVAEKYIPTNEHVTSYVNLDRVWYDGTSGIVMKESHDANETKVRVVEDYNTGVSYTFVNEQCSIGPIKISDTAFNRGKSMPSNALKLSQSFMDLDGNYYYLGEENWRGINCEIWEGIKTNVRSDNVTYYSIVHTVYFMANNFQAVSGDVLESGIPVRILLNVQIIANTQPIQVEYNIFEFDDYRDKTEEKMETKIDQCFVKPGEKKYISIYYELPEGLIININRGRLHQLTDDATNLIAYAANVSVVRIPSVEIILTDKPRDTVVVNGIIVEKNTPLAQFYRYQMDVPALRKTVRISGTMSREKCASFCLDQNRIKNCKSFTYCKTKENQDDCFVSTMDASDVANIAVVPDKNINCELFIRGNMNISDFGIPLDTALDNLVRNKDKLLFAVPTFRNLVNVTASRVELKDIPFVVPDNFDLVRDGYRLVASAKSVFPVNKEIGSSEECYQECLKNPTISCSSFSYCNIGDGKFRCHLSSVFFKSDSQEYFEQIEQSTACKLYRKKAIHFFKESLGKVPLVQGLRILPNVDSPEQCSVACKNEIQFLCEGFEICQLSSTCVLFDTHILDIPENSLGSQPEFCTHFHLSYSNEFADVGELELKDPNAFVMIDLSFDACSRMCVTSKELSCRSINFCQTQDGGKQVSQCYLNTKSIDDGDAIIENSDPGSGRVCHHYFRTTSESPRRDEEFPDIKELNLREYEVHSEVNNLLENSMPIFVNEYHSTIKKEGLINQWAGGVQSSLYYFTNTEQVVAVGDGKCRVDSFRNASFLQETINWGWLNTKELIVGPSAILWRATINKPKYVEKSLIRGIECSKFVATDSKDPGMELSFYIPVSKWSTATGITYQTAARVVASGSYSLGERKIKLNTQMDFFYFRSKLQGSKANLMLPKGLGCVNLLNREVRVMPQMEQTISFVAEKYIPTNEHVTSYVDLDRVWYDGTSGIVMKESHDANETKVRVVEDYNTGVSYTFVNEQCSIGPIKISDTAFNRGKSMPSNALKLSQSFMDLDGNYYYLGEEHWRGINCEIWEGIKTNVRSDNVTYYSIVHTVYFMANNFQAVSGDVLESGIPVRILLNVQIIANTQPIQVEYNIFEFDDYRDKTEEKMETKIDQCFVKPGEKKYISIYYELPEGLIKNINRERLHQLTDDATNLIAYAANVSVVRIPSVEIILTDKPRDTVVVNGIMVEKNTPLAQFYRYQMDVPALRKTVRVSGTMSREKCASFCLDQNRIKNCKSFTYCKTKENQDDCFVSTMDASDVANITVVPDGNINCELFIRGNMNISDFGIPLDTALDNLVRNKDKVLLTVKTMLSIVNITATRVELKDIPFFVPDNFDLVRDSYRLVASANSVLPVNKEIGSSEECYQECLKNPTISCSSFSYCNIGDGKFRCRLSSVFFKSDSQEYFEQIEPSTACKLYRKKAIHFFEESKGKVPLVQGRRLLDNVNSAEQCSVVCKNEIQFRCEGFEICQLSSTCILFDTHILDIPENSLGSKPEFCTHFHLSYSAEFKDVGALELKDPNAIVMIDLSFDACSRMCRTSKELSCRSINFCQTQDGGKQFSQCYLNTKSIDEGGNIIEKNEPGSGRVCHHYFLMGGNGGVTENPRTTTPDPGIDFVFPTMKELFFGEYEVHSEVIDLIENTTEFFVEYQDLKNGRGRVDNIPFSSVQHSSLYYSMDNKQTIYINANSCAVEDFMSESINWGWSDKTNNLIGPSAMLFRATNGVPQYMGKKNIRGISTDQYSARDKEYAGITLTFYFSDSKWSNSGGIPLPVPVRLSVKGGYTANGRDEKINLQLDVVKFLPKKSKFDTFMIQEGLGCEGLKTTGEREFPGIDVQFTFKGEIYATKEVFPSIDPAQIIFVKLYFDGVNGLFKRQGADYTKTLDFNTGVSYLEKDGKCTVAPINSTWFNNGLRGEVVPMKTSKQFLNLDGHFYYLGKKLYRSVYCDVWETVKNDAYHMGKFYKRLVVTVYFTSNEYLSIMENDFNVQVPVTISYTVQEAESSTELTQPVVMPLNLFDFDEDRGRPFYDYMDIEKCMTEDKKKYFLVYFSADNETSILASQRAKEFTTNARQKIVESMGISLLRVKIINVFFNRGAIGVMGMIFERPAYLDGFNKFEDHPAPYTVQIPKVDITDTNTCAKMCLQETTFFCKDVGCPDVPRSWLDYERCRADRTLTFCADGGRFSMCNNGPTKDACFLSPIDKSVIKWGDTIPDFTNCKLYFRTTANSTDKAISLLESITKLNDNISHGKLKFTLEKMEFVASRLEEKATFLNFDNDKRYLLVFERRRLNVDSHTTLEVAPKSVGSPYECHQRCLDETNIECVSFSFCQLDHSCRLSSVFVNPAKNTSLEELEPGTATSCNVYRKESIFMFDAYPGRSSSGSGDINIYAGSPEECALLCQQESSFKCLGFEFCEDSSGCALHKTHLLDLPPNSKKSPICTYYASRFSSDFVDLGRFVLMHTGTVTQTSVSFEECAKLCSEAGENCRSINYCPNMEGLSSSVCDLNTLADQDPGTTLLEAETCSYYFKRDLRKLEAKPSTSDTPETKISSSKFTAISFGLIFIGIGIGLAAYVVAAWYKKKTSNPSGVTIRYVQESM